ncbi:sigma-70 family RNA polymerase sigma factor [Streptomyces sp. NPDC048251]|uniref:RNA polymerase sigma factor n=1 Tax=Streptomyces sp. NPDC048251 TaxID=3154501 RepID=UPI003418C8EE
MTQTVGSSGSIPAPRRRADKTGSLRQLFTSKRKTTLTREEAETEILSLFKSRRPYWYSVIGRKLPDLYVEDVFGQVGVRIAADFKKYDASTVKHFNAYIAKTCIRCAVDQLRRHRTEAEALKNGTTQHCMGLPETATDPDLTDLMAAQEGYLRVRVVMDDVLTDRQHTIYVLRHVMELNSRDIGEALDIKAPLVRKDLQAAQKILGSDEVRQRLRDVLGEGR